MRILIALAQINYHIWIMRDKTKKIVSAVYGLGEGLVSGELDAVSSISVPPASLAIINGLLDSGSMMILK